MSAAVLSRRGGSSPPERTKAMNLTRKNTFASLIFLIGAGPILACEDLPTPRPPVPPAPPAAATAAQPPPPTRTAMATVPTGPAQPAITPLPKSTRTLGMEEPFATITRDTYRTLKVGWRALGKKQYAEARASFHGVVLAYPDHTEARWLELRATALGGDLAAVPGLWRELLARDYVGYARRLDRSDELAALRASEHWSA